MDKQIDISTLLNERTNQFKFTEPLVIYGAGNTGREIAHFLTEKGIKIYAFIDAAAQKDQYCSGLPVFTLDQWLRNNSPTGYQCLVAIHNRDIFMPPLIDKLRSLRFRNVLTMIDFTNAFPDDQTFRFWLAPISYYSEQQTNIDNLFSILAEEDSQYLAEMIIRFRVIGDYKLLPRPSFDDQYFPKKLARWREPLRFVDCGAYDGDTLQAIVNAGYNLEAAIAFEPDPDNYQKLINSFPQFNIINLPCGVSSQTHAQKFSTGAGESSRISNTGVGIIQCVALDHAIPSFAPNLIKMDIEGSEVDALMGAEKIINRYRPNLAISTYHLPGHLWEVPLLIHNWNLGYRFYLRSHAYNSFDIVLYAVQEKL